MSGFVDTVVNVNITANSATPTQANFGTPAILAYHTHNTDVIRTYFDLAGLVADGFSVTEPAYYMAQSICQQNPRPPSFKVIRGTTTHQQTDDFTVTDHADGEVIGLDLTDPSGNVFHVTHTASSETINQVATALAAQFTIVTSGAVVAVANSAVVQWVVQATGVIWYPSNLRGGGNTDITTSNSPQTDLAAAALIDPAFYGVSIDSLSTNSIQAAAAWTETATRIFAYTTGDSDCLAADGGVFDILQEASYKRSYGQYSATPITYGATGLMAQRLTADPGSDTWAYKQIAGTAIDVLTPTQLTNIQGTNGNFYINIGGVNSTYNGSSAQGLFIDITRGIDALANDIQVRVLTLLVQLPKLPFTKKGIAMVAAEVSSALQDFVADGFLSNDPGFQPLVSIPDLKNIIPADKANRLLKGVNFSCVAQGAIQKVVINGTVNL